MATDVCLSTVSHRAVLIDTSFDTHLALSIPVTDTVSDLKKKILHEHHACFPNVGEIKIHAIKVKRRGIFYHLSDSMLVDNAFDVRMRNWFLSVDASNLLEDQHQQPHNPDSGDQLVCFGIRNNTSACAMHLLPDDPPKRLSNSGGSQLAQIGSNQGVNQEASTAGLLDLDTLVSKSVELEVEHNSVDHFKASIPDLKKMSHSDIPDNHDLRAKCKNDNSRNEISDMECNASPEVVQTGLDAKKFLKRKHKNDTNNEDVVCDDTLKGVDASHLGSDYNNNPENSLGDVGREASYNMKKGNKIITDQPCRTASSDTSKRSSIGARKTKELHVDIASLGKGTEYTNEIPENRVVDVLCNNSLEEDSEYRHAAKKRKIKTSNDNEGSLKENKDFACDTSKMPKIFEYSLGEGQRSTNTNVEGISAKPLEDDQSMRTNKRSGEKKKKKKSSKLRNQVVDVVPNPVEDVGEGSPREPLAIKHKNPVGEPDAVIIPRQSVEVETAFDVAVPSRENHSEDNQQVEERNKATCSIYMDTDDANDGNVGSNIDASEVPDKFGIERMKSSKKNNDILDVKDQHLVNNDSNNLDKNVGVSRLEGTIPSDPHISGTGQTGRDEEVREVLQKNDTKEMLLENSKTSSLDENVKTGKEVVTPELFDVNGTLEPLSSNKKRKKSGRSKTSRGGTHVMLGAEHAKGSVGVLSSAEVYKPIDGDHARDESTKKKTILSQTGGEEVSKIETAGTYDEVTGNEVESSHQLIETRADTENIDGKRRKKTKKKLSSTVKNLPHLQKGHVVRCEDTYPKSDNKREEDASSEITKKTISMNHLNALNLVPGKDAGVGIEPLSTELISRTVKCLEPLSKNAVASKSDHIDESNNAKELSGENDRINFVDYFVASKLEHVVDPSGEPPIDAVTEKSRTDGKSKAKRNSKKPNGHSIDASPGPPSSLKLNKNQESRTRTEGENPRPIKLHASLSKNETDELTLQSNKKLRNLSGSQVKASLSSNLSKLNSTSEKVKRRNVIDASKSSAALDKNSEAFAVTSSSMESYKGLSRQNKRDKKFQYQGDPLRNPTEGNKGVIVNHMGHESLLSTSGKIFPDYSSGSSGDEAEVYYSDVSTGTPSDVSSHDSSDGESNATLNSLQNGSYSTKREGSGKNFKEPMPSSPKSLTLDKILRSSKRYKKAKETASQLQHEDTESQPVDFVPDSQTNL